MAMHFPSKSFPPDQSGYNKNSLVWQNLHILNGLSLSSWHIISQFHCTSPSAHSFPQKISSSRYVSLWHLFLLWGIWRLSHLSKQRQTEVLHCVPLSLHFLPYLLCQCMFWQFWTTCPFLGIPLTNCSLVLVLTTSLKFLSMLAMLWFIKPKVIH